MLMNSLIQLNKLKYGEKAIVCKNCSSGNIRRRLMDIGLVENTPVECVGINPMGDPAAYLIKGAVIAIRSHDCSDIYVKLLR